MVKVTLTGHPTSGFNTKTHYGPSGYKEGLILGTEDCLSTSNCTGANRVRWTWTSWTQDNTGVSYITNPRVTETQVGDGTNTKKTTIEYYTSGGTYPYGLPEKITVGDLSNIKKTEKIFYNLNSNYTSRRIIGLPAEKYLYEGPDSGPLMSKVTYTYDDYTSPEPSLTDLSSPTQQCRTTSSDCPSAYGTSFTYRGNVTKTTRWDVNYPTSETASVSTLVAYNIAGLPVSTTDPRGRVTTLSYSDANMWNDGVSRTTYAYPTTIADPGSNSSTIKYRYDFGANVEANSPAPAGQFYGKKTKRTFNDTIGRIDRQSVYVNTTEKAYTRYEYFSDAIHHKTYTPLVDLDNDGNIAEDEVVTETWTDGAGRVLKTRTENPDGANLYTAKKVEYDILGRPTGETVPTLTDSSWNPTGDDYRNNTWLWMHKEYDWKGRVTREINTDNTDKVYSYAGCGCAGGQMTTISGEETTAMNVSGGTQDDARRTQKVYEDILGRVYKTELWDLDGAGSAPYSTTKTTFNGRDQATLIRRYVGADTSSTYQDTTMSYDGHGRLLQKHLPEESGTTPYTAYTYKADDMIATVTDANGSEKTFFYGELDSHGSEDRALLTKISYDPGSGLDDVADVTFSHDGAGNRTQMAEGDSNAGTGTTTYAYDELSRLISETKTFPSTWYLPNSPNSGSRAYTITYNYFLNGSVKKVIDPFGYDIDYTADHIGRMKTVTGDAFGDTSVTQYVDDVDYRAWGAEKTIDLHNNLTLNQTFDSRLRTHTYEIERQGYTAPLFDKTYTYLPDGKLNHSTEGSIDRIASSDFERSYVFDFAGRLRKARTGEEARGNPPGSSTIPYHLDYSYDAFDHNTQRQGSIWFGGSTATPDSENQTWNATTNRASGWSYDAAGNLTDSVWYNPSTFDTSVQGYTYDAAGSIVYAQQDSQPGSVRYMDGMQRPVYISDNYLIYSTVFGFAEHTNRLRRRKLLRRQDGENNFHRECVEPHCLC
jgi:YD repeat-containing protein